MTPSLTRGGEIEEELGEGRAVKGGDPKHSLCQLHRRFICGQFAPLEYRPYRYAST